MLPTKVVSSILLLAYTITPIHSGVIGSSNPIPLLSLTKSHSNIIIPIPIPIPVPGSTEPPREILVPVYQGRPPHHHHHHERPDEFPLPPRRPPRPEFPDGNGLPPRPSGGGCGPRRLQFFVNEVDIPRGCHSDPLNSVIDSIQLGLEQMQWDVSNFFRGGGEQEPQRPFRIRIREFDRRMNRVFNPIRRDIRYRRKNCGNNRSACQQEEDTIFTVLEGFVNSLFEIPKAITCLFGECSEISAEDYEEGEV